jgi:hypothetical protein
MKPAIADVMIHVDENLPEEGMCSIADLLCESAHVASGCVSSKDKHLIMVRYDSDAIHAQDLLDKVRRCGVHAELVGL